MLKVKPLSSEKLNMEVPFKNVLLYFFLGLLVSDFSSANTKGQSVSQRKSDKLQHSLLDKIKEKEEWRARGVIIKFHRWPNAKQQKQIIRRLKLSGLKKTKSIRSFQTQLFEWSEGGLKLSKQGEKACKTLKGLSSIKRCNPDHSLPINRQKSKVFLWKPNSYREFNDSGTSFILAEVTQNTEAGFIEHCASCEEQNSISPVPLNIRICNLLLCQKKSRREMSPCNHLMEGTLSDYWAQELVGSDLLKEELKKIPSPKRPNWIAVFDTQKEGHNIYVKNLISDEGPHAVLPELRNRTASLFQTKKIKQYESVLSLFDTGFPGDYVSEAEYLKKAPPHFINNSMTWANSKDIYEVFQKLSPFAIIVKGSGNASTYIGAEDMQSKASENFNVILVGSFSPNGFVSGFSNSGKEVHIMAPSDDWITSAGKDGEYKKFAGTSGATPLVTGSLAGFEWLSGYHPTAEEAKILLEKTSIPTLHSHEEPQINGAGLVNAYKLGEVGKRLKKKCKNKSLFCFKEEILKEETYRFDLDKSLKRDLSKVFPACAIRKKSANSLEMSSCEKKGEVFKRLRKAVLLNPKESKEFLNVLGCIYREGGFSQNAEAIDKLALALGSKEDVRASVRALAEKEEPISDEVFRLMLGIRGFEEEFSLFKQERAVKMAGRTGESALPLVKKAFRTGNPDLQKAAVYAASEIGESALFLLEEAFETGSSNLQRKAVEAAGRIGEPALLFLEEVFIDSPNLQKTVLRAMGNVGEPALPFLEEVFKTGSPDLQEMVVYVAGEVGEAALFLVEKAFKTDNFDLQEAAVYVVHNIGEPALPFLKEVFKTGSLDEQKRVVRAMYSMGPEALPFLEEIIKTDNPDDLQKKAVRTMGSMGTVALPFLEEAFETGEPNLQREAVYAMGEIGEPALPKIEEIFDTSNPALQVVAVHAAIDVGVSALHIIKKAFDFSNFNLQKRAVYAAGWMGEVGLPLVEKAFNTGNPVLQLDAVTTAGNIGEPALPLLKSILNNKNLPPEVKRKIREQIRQLE